MRTLGFVALVGAGVGVVTGLVTAVFSIPDLKRYLRIRSM